MRALALVVLVGCSPAVALSEPQDGAVEEDAAPEPEDAGAPSCTPSRSSIPYGTRCDGGYRYGSYGGTCPTGDVGECVLLSADAIDNYAEACCTKLACVRVDHPTGDQCDGGAGWSCPGNTKPAGACVALFAGSRDYCCAD